MKKILLIIGGFITLILIAFVIMWNLPKSEMSEVDEMREIAIKSKCLDDGTLTGDYIYDTDSKTYLFALNDKNEICNYVCVVHKETKTAEVSAQCLGALPDGKFGDEEMNDSYTMYENQFYGFSLVYPKDFKMCLNDMCNPADDEKIQHVFLRAPLSDKEGFENNAIHIRPNTNKLGMSAKEYAKKIFEQNKIKGYVASEFKKQVQFAGKEASEFYVKNGYSESGFSIDAWQISLGDGEMGQMLNGTYRVLFIDKGDYIFRVMYPTTEASESYAEVIESLRFIE